MKLAAFNSRLRNKQLKPTAETNRRKTKLEHRPTTTTISHAHLHYVILMSHDRGTAGLGRVGPGFESLGDQKVLEPEPHSTSPSPKIPEEGHGL